MMSEFIAVPQKKTSQVDLIKPLKNIISSTYSTSDNPEDYSEALDELNKLRMSATKILDKHESSLDILYRYYDQLTAIEAKMPSSDIQIAFKWKDAFDKGSFFGGRMELTASSMAYEKVCILFNVAAMQSQIAASQNTETDEGLKLMAKLFQQASGIFNHLINIVTSSIQQEPTPDLSPDTLSALSSLMIAQAQESFFFKAINDRMKDAIIAKITAQVEDRFADALEQMQKKHLKPLWGKDWIGMVAGKQAVYLGITEYYQSQVAKSQKLFGEALSRLQHSIKAFTVAESRFSKKGLYTHWIVKVQKAFDETKKDNDFIYHEDVSNVKDLPLIDKAALAKPIPPGERLSTNFKDMFGSCAQTSNVNASLAANDMTKTSDVNREMEKLSRTMTRETTTIREEDSLVAIQRNKAKRMLDQEQKSDIQLQFQERCMSMTSEKVPKLMRLNHTILLSKSEHELAAKAPSANDLESSSTASQLRGIMEAVEANKAEQTILAKDGSIPFFCAVGAGILLCSILVGYFLF